MKKKILFSPSILSADLLQLREQIQIVERAGADFIHVDIMDGHFVPNITFGPVIVKTLKKITELPLDVHLMISDPDFYAASFISAGANIVTIHQESGPHLHRSLQIVRENGALPGVTINPATDISAILPVLGEVYLVLIMTVNPGFGAQEFIEFTVKKIEDLDRIRKKNGLKFLIEVDGGINAHTAEKVVRAGADILVAGHAIFGQSDISAAFHHLKQAALHSLD